MVYSLLIQKNADGEWRDINNNLVMPIWKLSTNTNPLNSIVDKNTTVNYKWISAKKFDLGNGKYIIMPNLDDSDTLKIIKDYCGIKSDNLNEIFKKFIELYFMRGKNYSEFNSRFFNNILSSVSTRRKKFYYDYLVERYNDSSSDKFDTITKLFYLDKSENSPTFFNNFCNNEYIFNLTVKTGKPSDPKQFTFLRKIRDTKNNKVINKDITFELDNIAFSVTYDIENDSYKFNNQGFYIKDNIEKLINQLFDVNEKNNISKYPSKDLNEYDCKSKLIEALEKYIKEKLTNPEVKEIENKIDLEANLGICADKDYPLEYKDKNIKINVLDGKTINRGDIEKYLKDDVSFIKRENNNKLTILKNTDNEKIKLIRQINNYIWDDIKNCKVETCTINLSDIFEKFQNVRIISKIQFIDPDFNFEYSANTINEKTFDDLIADLYGQLKNRKEFADSEQEQNFKNDFNDLLKNFGIIRGNEIKITKKDFPNVQWKIIEKTANIKIGTKIETFEYVNIQLLKKILKKYFDVNFNNNNFGIFELTSTKQASEDFINYICEQIKLNANSVPTFDIYKLIEEYNKSAANKIIFKKFKNFEYLDTINKKIESFNYFDFAGDWTSFVRELETKISNLKNYSVLKSKNGVVESIVNNSLDLANSSNINDYEKDDTKYIKVEDIVLKELGGYNRNFLMSFKNRKIWSNGKDKIENCLDFDSDISKRDWLIRTILQDGLILSDNNKNIERLKKDFPDAFNGKNSLFEIIKGLLLSKEKYRFIFSSNDYDTDSITNKRVYENNEKYRGFVGYDTFVNNSLNYKWDENNIYEILFSQVIKNKFNSIYKFVFSDNYWENIEELLKTEHLGFEIINNNGNNELTLKIAKHKHFNDELFKTTPSTSTTRTTNEVVYAVVKNEEIESIISDDFIKDSLLKTNLKNYLDELEKNHDLLFFKDYHDNNDEWKDYFENDKNEFIEESLISYFDADANIAKRDEIMNLIRKKIPNIIFNSNFFVDITFVYDENDKIYKVIIGENYNQSIKIDHFFKLPDVWKDISNHFILNSNSQFDITANVLNEPKINLLHYFDRYKINAQGGKDPKEYKRRVIVNRLNDDMKSVFYFKYVYDESGKVINPNIKNIDQKYEILIEIIKRKITSDLKISMTINKFKQLFNDISDEMYPDQYRPKIK